MSYFDLPLIPEEMRRLVYEKTTSRDFALLNQCNRLTNEECTALQRKPFVKLNSVIWHKNITMVTVKSNKIGTNEYKWVSWRKVLKSGYRLWLERFNITTDFEQRLEEAMKVWQERIFHINCLVLKDLPLELSHRLTIASKAMKINVPSPFAGDHVVQYVTPTYHPAYLFPNDNDFTDEFFLEWDGSIGFTTMEGHITRYAVVEKLQRCIESPVKGRFVCMENTGRFKASKLISLITPLGFRLAADGCSQYDTGMDYGPCTITHRAQYEQVCKDDSSNLVVVLELAKKEYPNNPTISMLPGKCYGMCIIITEKITEDGLC